MRLRLGLVVKCSDKLIDDSANDGRLRAAALAEVGLDNLHGAAPYLFIRARLALTDSRPCNVK